MLSEYKIKNDKKKRIIAGAKSESSSNNFWNNSIGFGIIGSTILSIVQFVFNAVSSLVNKNDTNSSKTSNYNPTYSQKKISYRLSKYPSKSNVFF